MAEIEIRLSPADLESIADRVAAKLASKLAPQPNRNKEPAAQEWIGRTEFARRSGLSTATLDRRIRDGSLPTQKVGRRVLIRADALA